MVAKAIVDSALSVHRTPGPGLLEAVFEACLCQEFRERGLAFMTQCSLPLTYHGVRLNVGLRCDLIVENRVMVELKSVDKMVPIFEAQVLTYLKLTGLRLGLLINSNVPMIKLGIKRLFL